MIYYFSHRFQVNIVSRHLPKGGVGKTLSCFTSAFELAFANPGKKILMVDGDAQCNLTQLVLGHTVDLLVDEPGNYAQYFDCFPNLPGLDTEYIRTCNDQGRRFDGRWNLFLALLPAIRPGMGTALKTAQLISVGMDNLFLLPGSERMYEVDEDLARAAGDSSHAFRGQLGAFYHLMRMTAAFYEIDLIVIDLPPSLSAWTRVAIMSSDFFIIPFQPDSFSMHAIFALKRVFLQGLCFFLNRMLIPHLQGQQMG